MSSQGKSTPYGASLQHPLAPVPTAVRKHSGKCNKGKKGFNPDSRSKLQTIMMGKLRQQGREAAGPITPAIKKQ